MHPIIHWYLLLNFLPVVIQTNLLDTALECSSSHSDACILIFRNVTEGLVEGIIKQ